MKEIKNKEFNKYFDIHQDEDSRLLFLGHSEDTVHMNWIEGKKNWGTIVVPEGIEVSVQREFTPEGNLRETYKFTNMSAFPVFIKRTDIGIYTTFNDNYQEASTCLEQRCHTHLFCGKEAAYAMTLRMSGRGPHLGMKVIKGSIASYSVEREVKQRSNDRGDFVLHPEIDRLEPGKSSLIQWELFWYTSREEFYTRLLETFDFPVVLQEQCTWYKGDMMHLRIACRSTMEDKDAMITYKGQELSYTTAIKNEITWINADIEASEPGECRIDISWGGRRTYALFYICESIEKLAEKRCYFLVEKQQFHDERSSLDGAYLIYDNEEDQLYYSHLDDHNGGRERLAMGTLMAYWLQRHRNETLEKSLELYEKYVYRELYDCDQGNVYNDIRHNLDWDRLYNYPWMARFQLELYHLKGTEEYLDDAYRTLIQYYRKGGIQFYSIDIPAKEVWEELKKCEKTEAAEILAGLVIQNADVILKNGLNYPESEVAYEQSIVAPAVSCLLQTYEITGRKEYLAEAKRQLEVLSLFNGRQPDFHLFETAIRHWDGYWFGKYRRYGDTFPHYWSALTGVEYLRYEKITGDQRYHKQAEASIMGCLNLFAADGSASCAMVFPETVNGEKGHYYDPWANDQDWALYYALKYLIADVR